MKYPEDFINKIICGDCLEVMKEIPDKSIDLVVTSPPYDNLRDYKGYSFNFKGIAKELYRVTKKGGIVVWVVADASSKFCESLTGFKQAIYFNEIGFNLLDTMIYYKENYAPIYPSLMRYANQFEYMFVLSKGKPKTFNPIQKNKIQVSKGRKTYRQQDGSLKEKILKDNNRKSKDASNVWGYAVGNNPTGHPAVFPEDLARDHILSWSEKNDLILDPMNGSGTTTKMAKILYRKFIGIEISPEYCKIAEQRLAQEVLPL